jgi:thymidylate kinase
MTPPMPGINTIYRQESSARAEGNDHSSLGRILFGVFEMLDRAGIPYCVLHGYESYPERITSDVDCLISAIVRPDQLAVLFHENRARIGADLVYCRDYWFLFVGKNADCSPCFLALDFGVDCELGRLKFYSGAEVIESRYRHRQFWVPAAQVEFGCYLITKIAKAQLKGEQRRTLSALYARDPAGCRQQIGRFWGRGRTALIVAAASTGDWDQVGRLLPSLRAEMRLRAMSRHPWYAIGSWVRLMGRQMKSACWPEGGLTVCLLGPDGAGKSSVIKAVSQGLAGAFNRTTCYGFAPGILSWLRRPEGPNTQPHAAPPRSPLISVTRALCYWLVYYLLWYRVTLRLHLAHSTLVLHDRHLVDALVDPKRYRYSGPMWLLRLIWWFVPRPDLIILLDAPPVALQSRKHDVSFAESERQGKAYRSLVRSMANGHIVDTARPLEEVVRDVHDIILNYLTTRVAARVERTRPTQTKICFSEEAERDQHPGDSSPNEQTMSCDDP